MLGVDHLTKRYGDLLALDDVSFTVERGSIVGFLGPNGAGKTTTMRAIMRLLVLDGGSVTWEGRPVDAEVRRGFGYMPAERGMYPRMRVRDHLVYYARLSGMDAPAAGKEADRWLERLDLSERSSDQLQNLSSGNQQRIQLALALLDAPDVLVLDEPFSGLDPLAVETLNAILLEQVERGAALLLSSHQLDLVADVCSTVVIVDHGRVVLAGDVAELRAASPVRYVDVEFATPTPWQGTSDDGRRYRVAAAQDDDGAKLIAAARNAGTVVAYGYAPPDLSEVFLGAVGRTTMEDEGTAT
jgi:ABC-2 type transport system ATP-binding protein